MAERDPEVAVNYEVDGREVIDEVEQEIELLDQEYIDEDDGTDDIAKQVGTVEDVETQQRIQALKERLEGGENDTATAMKEVVETLKTLRDQPKSQQQKEVVEDLDALRKKLGDGFYDDPMGAVDTWIEKRMAQYERTKLNPALNQLASVLKDTALDSSKRAAQASDTGKFVMSKYAGEVEALISSGQIQIGPGAYDKAIGQIATQHMSEFVDWTIEQREKAKADTEAATKTPGKNAAPTSGGGTAAPKPNKNIQVTTAARDAIYAMADQKMLNRDQFFEMYVRKHPEKVRELNRRPK